MRRKVNLVKSPHGGAKDAGDDDPDGGENRQLRALVSKIVSLPTEEFLPTLVALIGPPPVKQPLQLGEATVIEGTPQKPKGTS